LKNYINLLTNLIFYLLIFIGIFRFTDKELKFLLNFLNESNKIYIFLILFLKVLMVYTSVAQHKILYEEFNLNLTNFENLKLIINSMMGNFFSFAKHGSIYKAKYLNQNFSFKYKSFVKFFLVLNILSIALNFLIIFMYFLWKNSIFYFILTLSIIGILSFFYKNKISKIYSLKVNSFIKLFLLQIISLTFYCIALYYLSKAIGLNLNFLQIIIFSIIVSLSILISITPNSIGIREFLLLLVSSSLIISRNEIILLSLLDRLTDALFLILFFLIVNILKIKNK